MSDEKRTKSKAASQNHKSKIETRKLENGNSKITRWGDDRSSDEWRVTKNKQNPRQDKEGWLRRSQITNHKSQISNDPIIRSPDSLVAINRLDSGEKNYEAL
jgi:hypothetical protein